MMQNIVKMPASLKNMTRFFVQFFSYAQERLRQGLIFHIGKWADESYK